MTNEHPWVKHYQTGVPAEIEMPTTSLVEMCERSVREAGDAVAMEFFGKKTTYRELGEQIERAAEGLRRLGVKAGDRVGILLPNCPQHVVAFYAVLRIGAIVVEHNPLYTARELRHMFEDHRAEIVIAWDAAVEKIADLPRDLSVRRIIAVNLLDEFPTVMRLALNLPIPKLRASRDALHKKAPGTMPWKELVASPRIDAKHPKPTVDDLAVIQYTSGTTGNPKGAMLTHRNLYANALQGAAWMIEAEDRKEIVYALLPMFHAFGMTLYLTFGILKQSHLVLFPKFDVDLVLKAWKKSPATVYCAVPPIYRKTADVAKERGIDISSARFCISGAMALTDEIVHDWEEVSGGLLVEGYGLTETSPVALGNPFATSRRTGTIGIPFPSTDMKVVDTEDLDREVERGKQGELLLAGPQVFQGYWQNPEETAKMLLPGGWIRTGDVVVQDEDGFTTIVDRVKELIITGGFNVSPSEVERVLRAHDAIEEAAVVGRPAEHGGEEIVAALVLRDGAAEPSLEEIRAFCKTSLAAYKAPRAITIVEELPKSMLGKVLRKQVRDELI